MDNINATLFIYAKEGKIKVFDLENAPTKSTERDFLKEGWRHTATIDPCAYLEYLVNDVKDIVAEVKSLVNPTSTF